MLNIDLAPARSLVAITALAMLAALSPFDPSAAGGAAYAAPAAKAVTIKIANFDFGPGVVTVPVGTAVTWINDDDDAHSVVAVGKAFRSAPLDTGDHYTFTFQVPGTYVYHCGLHPQMVGKVIVTR